MKYVIWYSLNGSSNVIRLYCLRRYFSTHKEAENELEKVIKRVAKEVENQLEKAIKRVANEGLIGIEGEYSEIYNFEGVSCGIMPVKNGFLTKTSGRWAKSFN